MNQLSSTPLDAWWTYIIMQIAPGLHLNTTRTKTRHSKERETAVNLDNGHINTCRTLLLTGLLFLVSACVYQLNIQQGNKLELNDVEALEVGMTRNQVRYLLGTPVVSDLFREDRWDYVYYFRMGRNPNVERRWLIVWFDGNLVSKVDRDVPVYDEPPPASPDS
jgi:outer membrane protein assembly factor BamE